jgi:hypothetical protein
MQLIRKPVKLYHYIAISICCMAMNAHTHRKKATRDRERSSNAVRDDAKISRRTTGVTGKRRSPGVVLGRAGVMVEAEDDEGGMAASGALQLCSVRDASPWSTTRTHLASLPADSVSCRRW